MTRALLVLALVTPIVARADFVLSHAGLLLDAADQPLNATALGVTFKVFDTGTSGSGTSAWEATCPVDVTAGYYAVTLGASCGSPFTIAQLPSGAGRWLELTIDGITLTPRLRLGAAPTAGNAEHAADADTLDGHPPTDFAAAAHTHAAAQVTGLATVATTGDYASLSGTPTLATVATTGDYASLSGLPTLGTAAAANVGSATGNVPTIGASGGLTIAGTVESSSGGFRFPDGTVQTTASSGGGSTSGSGTVDAATTLLLHFNGNPNDASASPVSLTNNATAFSSTTFKLGGGAAQFNGSTSSLVGPTGPATQFPGDFTVDLWAYVSAWPATNTYAGLFDTRNGPGAGACLQIFNAAGTPQLLYSNNTTLITVSNPFAINTWVHLAAVRVGSTVTLYVNGNAVGTTTQAGSLTDGALVLGRTVGSTNFFNGLLDEVRVSKGVARWTAAFTPPTQEYGSNTWSSLNQNVYYSQGSVGIGTATPGALLDVYGTTGQILATSSGKLQVVRTAATPALTLSVENRNAPLAGLGPLIGFYGNTDGGSELGNISSGWRTASTNDAFLSFATRGSGTSAERMRLDHAGNLGIGTTAPAARLDVSGHVKLGTGYNNLRTLEFASATSHTVEIGSFLTGSDNTSAFIVYAAHLKNTTVPGAIVNWVGICSAQRGNSSTCVPISQLAKGATLTVTPGVGVGAEGVRFDLSTALAGEAFVVALGGL